jgi:hypothetical protein
MYICVLLADIDTNNRHIVPIFVRKGCMLMALFIRSNHS